MTPDKELAAIIAAVERAADYLDRMYCKPRLPEEVQHISNVREAATLLRRIGPADGDGWKPAPTAAPLTAADAGHELEHLIVLEAWRQFDGDWWLKATDSFIAGDRPLAVMVDTPENRASLYGDPR
jgi:hypothetical protein